MSNQYFEQFKQEHPRIAEAMGILGMTHAEYCEAYDRMVIQRLIVPPRISVSDHTEPLPRRWQVWYSNSTAQKE